MTVSRSRNSFYLTSCSPQVRASCFAQCNAIISARCSSKYVEDRYLSEGAARRRLVRERLSAFDVSKTVYVLGKIEVSAMCNGIRSQDMFRFDVSTKNRRTRQDRLTPGFQMSTPSVDAFEPFNSVGVSGPASK